MVRNEAVAGDSHAVVAGIAGEQVQAKAIVFGAEEDLLSNIGPLSDMVGKARDYDTRDTGHTEGCDPRPIQRMGNKVTVRSRGFGPSTIRVCASG